MDFFFFCNYNDLLVFFILKKIPVLWISAAAACAEEWIAEAAWASLAEAIFCWWATEALACANLCCNYSFNVKK